MTLSNYGSPTGLIVAKSVAYAAKNGGGTISGINEVDELADGAIAVFTEDNTLVTVSTTVANLANVAKFWIARGNPSTKARFYRSNLVNRNAATRTKKVGVVPVKQAITVGLETDGGTGSMNFPTTLEAGTIASIVIVQEKNTAEIAATMKRYEYLVTPSDDEPSIISGLVALINADPAAIVVASTITDTVSTFVEGLLLTAKDYFMKFDVGVDDIIEFADVTRDGTGDSVVFSPGKNSYTEMKELEVIHQSVLGRSDTGGQNLLFSVPSQVDEIYTNQSDSDTPMDTWSFQWTASAVGPGVPRSSDTLSLIVAFVNGSAVLGNFETILGVMLAIPEAAAAAS